MTCFFTIDKSTYLQSIEEAFQNESELHQSVRLDVGRMYLECNGKVYHTYDSFVHRIRQLCVEERIQRLILMLCNQTAHYLYYERVFTTLQKRGIHLVSAHTDLRTSHSHSLSTTLHLTPMLKQVVLQNVYHALQVSEMSSIDTKVLKLIRVSVIIDLNTMDPVLVKLQVEEQQEDPTEK